VLVQIAIVGVYLFMQKGKKAEETTDTTFTPPANTTAPAAPFAPAAPAPVTPVSTVASKAVVSDAKAALDSGQWIQAKAMLDKLIASTPDPDAIALLGDVNMKLLKSQQVIPGKSLYTIQPGDSLDVIRKKYNTTTALIKEMNGIKDENRIRAGASIQVFQGDFSIRVSKSRNELDLMLGDKLFKRYKVGTGKFGKTPAVEFTIVAKITEPPWTRLTDGKQIEYGDPENVLGTRWMAIKSDAHPELTGFGIHGTWERDSVGHQTSAGCVRMLNEDVEELFDLVPRKTTVIITE
jgi:lipoprotein-anchoring transpeptidase ErfK/SrfK